MSPWGLRCTSPHINRANWGEMRYKRAIKANSDARYKQFLDGKFLMVVHINVHLRLLYCKKAHCTISIIMCVIILH
jgi:hypothetical protein